MKLLSFAASFREQGNNHTLAQLADGIARGAGAEVEHIPYASLEAPFYREDAPDAKVPSGILAFAEKLRDADGLMIAAPEHNWSFPASLKNMIDWLSTLQENPLANKTALLMCATPSRRGGIAGLLQLRVPLEVLGCWVYPQVVGIGNVYKTLSAESISDAKDMAFLTQSVQDFVRITGLFCKGQS